MLVDQLYQNYLLRLMQMRELIRHELLLKSAAGDGEGGFSVLDSICRRTIGIPLGIVRRTPPERLLELIQVGGQSNFNSILIAEVLLEDVELSEKTGKIPQAIVSRLQAFSLLVDSIVLLGPAEQAEYRKKLDALAEDLRPLSGDPYIQSKIEGYQAKKPSN